MGTQGSAEKARTDVTAEIAAAVSADTATAPVAQAESPIVEQHVESTSPCCCGDGGECGNDPTSKERKLEIEIKDMQATGDALQKAKLELQAATENNGTRLQSPALDVETPTLSVKPAPDPKPMCGYCC